MRCRARSSGRPRHDRAMPHGPACRCRECGRRARCKTSSATRSRSRSARRRRAPSPSSRRRESDTAGRARRRTPRSCRANRRWPRKCCTLNPRKAAWLAPSDRHSAVHPPVNALGNHAITTACRPRKSLSWCVRPSEAGSVKSGAGSPTRRSTCVGATRPSAAFAMPVATAPDRRGQRSQPHDRIHARFNLNSCHSNDGLRVRAVSWLQLFSFVSRPSPILRIGILLAWRVRPGCSKLRS